MSRAARIFGANVVYHVVINCNNNEFLFKRNGDFLSFLRCLKEAKDRFSFSLHAYQIMHNHVHLILQTGQNAFLDAIMHWTCNIFSKKYNIFHKRTGHFWRNRYKAKVIDNDLYGLACLRYIHRNALDIIGADQIERWRWSCYRFYAFGNRNDLITPLPSYLALDDNKCYRQNFYVRWVREPFLSKENNKILFESKLKPGSRRQKKLIKELLMPAFEKIAKSH